MKELIELKEVIEFKEDLKNFIYDFEICTDNIGSVLEAHKQDFILRPIEVFIGHYVSLAYAHCSINTFKIFHPKEKRGFQKLFNKFKNFRYNSELLQMLDIKDEEMDSNRFTSKNDILNSIMEIENNIRDHSDLLDKIHLRRLRFYAHTDPDSSNIEVETLTDLLSIKELAITIYNSFFGRLFGSHFMFNHNLASIESVLRDRKMVDDCYKEMEKLIEQNNNYIK